MDRNISRLRNGLQLDGRLETPDSTAVTVVLKDSRGILLAYGATVPTDAETGYAKGCIFIDTNAAAGAVMLANEGDADSCDFNTSLVSGDISAVTTAEGSGLSGGAASGAVDLQLEVDDDTIEIATNTVQVKDEGISAAKLATAILPSHVVKFAGEFTTAGGDAAEQATVSGVVATDIVIASILDNGGNNVTLLQSAAATDAINFTMSADPSTDCVISYMVLRAIA